MMGTLLIRHASDRLWTEKTGHRTPFNGLGTLPAPPQKPEKDDGDADMLDDLGLDHNKQHMPLTTASKG